jgi:hypothetical protein
MVWFVVAGPLVGIWWLLLLYPSPWRTGLIALVAAIPVIPLIIAAIATAGGTLATTGRLTRWLPGTGSAPCPSFDWDLARPSERIDDVAYALEWLTPFVVDLAELRYRGFTQAPDRRARVDAFLEAYGWDEPLALSRRLPNVNDRPSTRSSLR